jgi:ABC-type transporter Mla subunit MlaD
MNSSPVNSNVAGSAPKINGGENNALPTSLQQDINQIQSALDQLSNEESDDTVAELTTVQDVQQLLQSLERANGVAGGVEGKLDDLLSNLDSLLNALEPAGGTSKPDESESKPSVMKQ